jgi:hypothetical protein
MSGTRYVLLISHDLKQGEAGGTIAEPIIYDSVNGAISGSVSIQGKTLTVFVIECPKPL